MQNPHERLFKLRIKIQGQSSTEEGVYFGLKIEIINVNDNRPKFVPENETLFINEKFPLGQQIYKFRIIDHDLRIDDELMLNYTFVIVNQNLITSTGFPIELSRPVFSINKNLSLIIIDKPIQNQHISFKFVFMMLQTSCFIRTHG